MSWIVWSRIVLELELREENVNKRHIIERKSFFTPYLWRILKMETNQELNDFSLTLADPNTMCSSCTLEEFAQNALALPISCASPCFCARSGVTREPSPAPRLEWLSCTRSPKSPTGGPDPGLLQAST